MRSWFYAWSCPPSQFHVAVRCGGLPQHYRSAFSGLAFGTVLFLSCRFLGIGYESRTAEQDTTANAGEGSVFQTPRGARHGRPLTFGIKSIMSDDEPASLRKEGAKEPRLIRGICFLLAVLFIAASIFEIALAHSSWKFAVSSFGFGALFGYVAWRGRPPAFLGW